VTRRFRWPAALALGVLSIALLHAPDAGAADSANDCVRLRETQEGSGLRLEVDNNCDRQLACVLSWTVRCESATGRSLRESKENTHLVIGASSTRGALASAASCGDNWTIHDVSWDCHR
jgi:hypothetical protein